MSTETKIEPGTIVSVDGTGRYEVGVDNGSSVHLPTLEDHRSIDEGWMRNGRGIRHGEWGAPPRFNRWVSKERIQLIEGGMS